MSTPDFFRSRLDAMIDMRHPLVVLTGRLPWSRIEATLATKFERQDRAAQQGVGDDMFGEHDVEFGGGVGIGGRPHFGVNPSGWTDRGNQTDTLAGPSKGEGPCHHEVRIGATRRSSSFNCA